LRRRGPRFRAPLLATLCPNVLLPGFVRNVQLFAGIRKWFIVEGPPSTQSALPPPPSPVWGSLLFCFPSYRSRLTHLNADDYQVLAAQLFCPFNPLSVLYFAWTVVDLGVASTFQISFLGHSFYKLPFSAVDRALFIRLQTPFSHLGKAVWLFSFLSRRLILR